MKLFPKHQSNCIRWYRRPIKPHPAEIQEAIDCLRREIGKYCDKMKAERIVNAR
jgi:hypothetical protein